MRRLQAGRLLVGLTVAILLATVSCSGDTSEAKAKIVSISSVSVTGPTTSPPTVTFEAPISFATTARKIVHDGPGTGPAVEMSSLVTVQYVAINASDQSVFGSSWKSGPSTFYVNTVVKAFADGLVGAHAGDRVLIGSRSKDAYGATGNLASTVRPGDAVIFVVDITDVAPELPAPRDVPKLTYDADGNPSKFTASATTTPTPKALGVYPIVEGPGPVVKTGDTVSVEYFGQIYPDGKVFNAWTGEPFDAPLGAGSVIKGWDQGLVGQRVGSRVLLVIPPALGYGSKEQSGIPPDSTLIFAIQIVSVS